MSTSKQIASVRLLPDDVSNKIAAGEVVERPASVVKELVENALDAHATRILVRISGAGRRLIEVTDNGHGMSEQDALLAVERHATSKIRKSDDLDNIRTLGFRGEALASIASVSRFELLTRREKDESGTMVQIDGGILREVSQCSAPVGTRVQVNRLYFNTPVRAKFLKGVTTELSHCIDAVQRHALAQPGVAFQFIHNDKVLIDIPEHATLRERAALIWGLAFAKDTVELDAEFSGMRIRGLIGTPALTRASRSHQFFFLNRRPIVNRTLQYGFEDAYQGLLTIGRRPVGVVMLETHPRFADINIHPSKREVRFRDDRAARNAIRNAVRERLERLREEVHAEGHEPANTVPFRKPETRSTELSPTDPEEVTTNVYEFAATDPLPESETIEVYEWNPKQAASGGPGGSEQTEFTIGGKSGSVEPSAVYRPFDHIEHEAMQLFDTYLLVPEDDRLLIIDQHALHERLNYDALRAELEDRDYASQSLLEPILLDVPPSQGKLLESNRDLFSKLGIEIEPFGGNTFQVTSICHLYDESRIGDVVYKVLDQVAQGDLFDEEAMMADLLRFATRACRASVKAGDVLTTDERNALLDGFRQMRPPYTCPHGRPIITELTQIQMEKSFRRRQ